MLINKSDLFTNILKPVPGNVPVTENIVTGKTRPGEISDLTGIAKWRT
jgi:hypothetical protein